MADALDLDRYDGLLQRVYAASTDPDKWPAAVSAIAEMCDAPRAQLFAFSMATGGVGFSFVHNIGARELELYAARGTLADPFTVAAHQQGLFVDGAALLGSELVAHEELVKTDFYRDVWQPIDIGQFCCGIVFAGTDSMTSPTVLSVYRSLQDRLFDQHDKELMRRLVAHVSRSLGVMFHLREQDLRISSMTAALEALNSGVLLLDRHHAVVFSNSVARRILREGSTLVSTEGCALRLVPRLRALQGELRMLLERASDRTMTGEVEHFSNAMILPAESGAPRCVVHAAPAPLDWNREGGAPRVIVFAYDLESANVQAETLCELFGMTLSEALAALQVLQGGSLAEMAARQAISTNTFKTQLQAVYGKTSTHRQTDLLKLLLSLSRR